MSSDADKVDSPNDLSAVETAVQHLKSGSEGQVAAALNRLDSLLINDDDNRIHFRSVNGMAAVVPHMESLPGPVLDVLTKVCLNDKNISQLCVAGPASDRPKILKDILSLLSHDEVTVRRKASLCLALCSEEGERTRRALTEAHAAPALFEQLEEKDRITAGHCLRAVKCLAADTKFRGELRSQEPAAVAVLSNYVKKGLDSGVLEDGAGAMALLCNDPGLRRHIDLQIITDCTELLSSKIPEIVIMNMLGALLNACVEDEPRRLLHEKQAHRVLLPLLKKGPENVRSRTAALIARAAQYGTASEEYRKGGATDLLIVGVVEAGTELQEPATRALAAMATKSIAVVEELGKTDLFKKLPKVIAEMGGAGVGNACMLVSQCAVNERNLVSLGPCVEPLVKVMHAAANDKRPSVAKNAAIALAKMAKEPKNLEKIRELHGIEIMMAYIKV